MVFKRFLLAVMLALAACQPRSSTSIESIGTSTPQATEEPPAARWLETEIQGISVGIWRQPDWETDLSDGLVLAEQTSSPLDIADEGILIHCFIPLLERYSAQGTISNPAWELLDWVIQDPNHTGWDVVMSYPEAFEWDAHEAAYYLMSTGDGVRGIILAVTIPDDDKVLVCNISAPVSHANRIREALPELLGGLSVDGTVLSGDALATLPDPLPFPRYRRATEHYEPQIVSSPSH